MIARSWDHPGKKQIHLNMKGFEPTLRIVVDPDVDGPALAAILTGRIKECVESTIRESATELLEYQDNGLQLDCSREEILLTAAEYQKQHEEAMKRILEMPVSTNFDATIDNNPDNGKYGMWLVSGFRYSCIVNRVSTARDALNKAIASGVGPSCCCDVKFLDPDGPEVFDDLL